MIRLEQVRGEMLERFERVDRRFAQHEQRVSRIEQRIAELSERIEVLRAELLAQLALLAWRSGSVGETATRAPGSTATSQEEDAILPAP